MPFLRLDADGVVCEAIGGLVAQPDAIEVAEDVFASARPKLGLCCYVDGRLFDHVPPPGIVDLSAYAKIARDRHEDGGITVSGVPIATDDRSKTLVLGARRRVEKDPSLVTKWSAADGSIYPLDASTIIAVSDAIGDFVAELFETYAGIMADLAAGTITTPGEIDARYGALDVAF